MIQRWEIYNWRTNQRVQLCDTEELAQKLISLHDNNHIVKKVLFSDSMIKSDNLNLIL
jgi:hypothetical protein